MKIPTIIPIVDDEDFTSWAYHLADLNCFSPHTFLNNFLNQDIDRCVASKRSTRYLKNIFSICESYKEQGFPSMTEVISKHYGILVSGLFSKPYHTAFLTDAVIHGLDPYPFSRICSRPAYKYCPICAREDITTYGRIITHVPHQVPGVTSCWKHHVQLTSDQNARTVSSAAEEENNIAGMIHTLYEAKAAGSISDLGGLIWDCYIYGNVSETAVIKASRIDINALINVFRSNEKLWPVVCRQKLITENPDTEILSSDFPFITLRCGRCGKKTTMYMGAILSGSLCPLCSSILSWEDRILRHVPSNKRATYPVEGFADKLHVNLKCKENDMRLNGVNLYYYLKLPTPKRCV